MHRNRILSYAYGLALSLSALSIQAHTVSVTLTVHGDGSTFGSPKLKRAATGQFISPAFTSAISNGSETRNFNLTAGHSYYVESNDSLGGAVVTDTLPVPDTSTTVLSFDLYFQGVPQEYYYNMDLENNTDFPRTYEITDGAGYNQLVTVPPRTLANVILGPFDDPVPLALDFQEGHINFTDTISPTDSGWFTGGTPGPADLYQDGFHGVGQGGVIPSIEFGGNPSTQLALDDTLKDGMNALNSTTIQGMTRNLNQALAQDQRLQNVETQLSGGFANLQGELQQVDASLGVLHTDLTGIGSTLDQAELELEGVNANLLNANGHLNNINNGINSMIQDFDQLLVDLDDVAQREDVQNLELSNEAEAAATRGELDNIQILLTSSFDDQDSRLTNIKNAIDDSENTAHSDALALQTLLGNIKSAVDQHRVSNHDDHLDAQLTRSGIKSGVETLEANSATRHTEAQQKRDDLIDQSEITNENLTNILEAIEGIGEEEPEEPDGEGQRDSGIAASTGTKNLLEGFTDGVDPGNASKSAPGGWNLSLAGHSFDLNPMNIPFVAAAASWLRGLITWAFWAFFLLYAWKYLDASMSAAMRTQQSASAGTSIAGTNINTVTALAMAALIVVATAAVPAFAVTYLSGSGGLAAISVNPFTSADSVVRQAVWLMDNFIPIDLLVTGLVTFLIYRASLSGITYLAMGTIKFLVG